MTYFYLQRRKQKQLKRQKRAATRQTTAAANLAKSSTNYAKVNAINNDNILIDDVKLAGKGGVGRNNNKKQFESTAKSVEKFGNTVKSVEKVENTVKSVEKVETVKSVSPNVHTTAKPSSDDVSAVVKGTMHKRKSIGSVMKNVPNQKFNVSSKPAHGKVSSLFYHNPEIPNVTV